MVLKAEWVSWADTGRLPRGAEAVLWQAADGVESRAGRSGWHGSPLPQRPGTSTGPHALAELIAWATSTHTQAEAASGHDRAFRRRTAWGWNVPVPKPPVTGKVLSQVFINGIRLSGGWVLLVARSPTHVIGWQWAASENTAAYTALLERLPPPNLVTTDGQAAPSKPSPPSGPPHPSSAAWSTSTVTPSET